ncbi:MAG: type IV pilus assembly protein PilM [Planctomycetales bacterium]|nr:type IV pilus assembly protein PilM [Planctomycetales bacterium]
MAEPVSAWGIDIGQAGLKAMKLRVSDDGERVIAAAFDYIPHPKILSQPDAIPEELIREAMKTFLDRNKIEDDLIAISVPGQSSLAKFIKLPPVEANKVAEIVKYEARQQIPFDLNDVIWDYQPLGGGIEESGFMLEAEVGLFAMKRELVFDALKPFTNNGKEVEIVQIAPLALYNYLSYDVMGFRKTAETPEPLAAEDYYVILDMGADNTTLLVSNGRNIWIRNVPIGGNNFTRALTREMKLTFAKAEHLKCNATKAPDPKAVFQAMRPVFNDYVSEIQRSIGFFGSVNRSAKIRKIIGVGNGFRLAGLQKFLQQNLQYEVERLESLEGVTGDSVLTDPLFIDNMMTFAVPYGLALQAIGKTRIRTTLLPPEIAMERKIRSKKPWAIAAAAGLLLAMGVSTMGSASVLGSYGESKWGEQQKFVVGVQSQISTQKTAFEATQGEHKKVLEKIDRLVAPLEKRAIWMELFKAVNESMPRAEGDQLDVSDITLQNTVRIESFTTMKTGDVSTWHKMFADAKPESRLEDFEPRDRKGPDKKEGYIVTLKGFHLHNNEKAEFAQRGRLYLDNTLVKNLRQWEVESGGVTVPVGKIGISHPILAFSITQRIAYDPNQRAGAILTGGQGGALGGNGGMSGYMGGGSSGVGQGMMQGAGAGQGMMQGAGAGQGMMQGAGAGQGMMQGAGAGQGMMQGAGAGQGMMQGAGAGRMSAPGGAGFQGKTGEGTGGNGQIEHNGPLLAEQQIQKIQEIDRTDFVIQFVWIPTLEKDRKDVDPRPAVVEDTNAASKQ